eukprot:TRINITY_DN37655_c0_g2_i1.p1 TRINITY_DN37655_c0_g2~~TRINITY_DN37655_c0_g2_i1.p1  ORF type:complete len:250 (+),score=63.87 TRINITY_DN37655_c0_g2_i1:123-872(+)
MIRRPPRSTLSSSSAASDVYKRQGQGKKRILVDTGDADFADAYMPVLRQAMEESGTEAIEQIVLTHWHRDHIGGVRALISEFGVLPVRKFFPAEGPEEVWEGEGDSPDEALAGVHVEPVLDGDVIQTDGATLRVMHTPGHATDHIVLLLEEECSMFTGDNVLGTGTPVFRDLPKYLASLRRMRSCCPGILYTSHGPMVEDGVAYIDQYIAHRQARVEQVLHVVQKSQGMALTPEEITCLLYTSPSPRDS